MRAIVFSTIQVKCHQPAWTPVEELRSGYLVKPIHQTNILVDYNEIKSFVDRYDHQIILNESDPMVPRIEEFHPVIATPGDPTSELLQR